MADRIPTFTKKTLIVDVLKASGRFNINNQQHKKVYDVLMDLDPNIAKLKSQFLIDLLKKFENIIEICYKRD